MECISFTLFNQLHGVTFYARELAIAHISYGNSVRLSVCHDPVSFQDQLR